MKSVTSWGDADDDGTLDVVRNQIEYAYNDWGQVSTSKQEHDGAVAGGTPVVTYGYDQDGRNLARLTSVTYPTASRVVGYSYGDSGTIDNRLSRVAAITDGVTGTPPHLADYTYLGAGTIVNSARPQVTDGLGLTYGAAGAYNGLDRFGRVVDQIWQNDLFNAVDEYKYGYNSAGNRTKRENVLADIANKDLSEAYSYDEVYRLIGTDRGQFDGGPFTGAGYQDWTLDGLGNFAAFNDDGTSQTRETNEANEIESITTGGNTTDLDYDDAGNLIGDGTLLYRYDAWNRQVRVSTMVDETEQTVAEYAFDGLNRRIVKTLADDTSTGYFYNENWQVLEERHFDDEAALVATDQYAWDVSYIDAPIVRFHDGNADGDLEDEADNILYYTWDANHNITALVNASDGAVVERYFYDPYGKTTICNPTTWAALADGPDSNTATGDESAFGNEILFAGYRYDPETALSTAILVGCSGNYSVRNRLYVTALGVFAQTDPIEADSNTYRYCGNRPTVATDPMGLWHLKEGNTIYEADSIEDSMQTLALEVGADVEDWVCIWPLPCREEKDGPRASPTAGKQSGGNARSFTLSMARWDDYPHAQIGALADVSNLKDTRATNKVYLIVSNGPIEYNGKKLERDDALDAYMKLLKNASEQARARIGRISLKEWDKGTDAADFIKEHSGEGSKPIHELIVVGHWAGTAIGDADGNKKFRASDLFTVATEKSNSYNTKENAAQRTGPPKCWFTKRARIWGVSCFSGVEINWREGMPFRLAEDAIKVLGRGGWAEDWASQVARRGATVYGTDIFTAFTFGPNGNPALYWTKDITMTPDKAAPNATPGEKTATTLGEFLRLPGGHWKQFDGTQ